MLNRSRILKKNISKADSNTKYKINIALKSGLEKLAKPPLDNEFSKVHLIHLSPSQP